MKTAWYDRYGPADVVNIRDVARPKVRGDEVLVKVQCSSVTTADWRLRAAAFPKAFWLPGRLMFGLFAPRKHVLGGNFAGTIVEKGQKVTRFAKGQDVFGFSGLGAHAEYLTIREGAAITGRPGTLGFDEAAAVPFAALTALVFLRDFAAVTAGQKVLVVGASGGVGVYATQLARHLGAEVTGVASTENLALVRSLGADHVIDYHTEDFTRASEQYDVILDTVGATTFSDCKPVLTQTGKFVPLEFGLREVWQSLTGRRGGKRVVAKVSGDSQEDLNYLRDLLERGELKPVIDSCLTLDRITEAYERVETRHKTGAVVLSVAPDQ